MNASIKSWYRRLEKQAFMLRNLKCREPENLLTRARFSHSVGVHSGLSLLFARTAAVSLFCVIFHSWLKSAAALHPPEAQLCEETPETPSLLSGKVHNFCPATLLQFLLLEGETSHSLAGETSEDSLSSPSSSVGGALTWKRGAVTWLLVFIACA